MHLCARMIWSGGGGGGGREGNWCFYLLKIVVLVFISFIFNESIPNVSMTR